MNEEYETVTMTSSKDDDLGLIEDEQLAQEEDIHSYGEALSDEQWRQVPPTPKHKAPFPNRVDVTLDMSDEDVLQYDDKGANLFWDGSLESFKELDDDFVKKLSNLNQTRYFSSFWEYQRALKRKDEPKISERIKVSPRLARATQRLEVYNKRPGMHYCWKRPDEVFQSKLEGYKTVSDTTVQSFMAEDSGAHKVAADGEAELVLMEIPKETFEEGQRVISEKSTRRKEAVDNQAREDIRRAGGIPYETKGPGGPEFTPSDPSRG